MNVSNINLKGFFLVLRLIASFTPFIIGFFLLLLLKTLFSFFIFWQARLPLVAVGTGLDHIARSIEFLPDALDISTLSFKGMLKATQQILSDPMLSQN